MEAFIRINNIVCNERKCISKRHKVNIAMKTPSMKHALWGLWAATSALTHSFVIAEAHSENRIKLITSAELLRNGANKFDMSSLNHDLNEASTIEVQLFTDKQNLIFYQEAMEVNDGWVGKNGKNTMKLSKNDGDYSGSIIVDDTTYYINTLEDGTTQFVRDQAVEDIMESINLMSPERDLSAVVDNCANNDQVAFDLSLTTDQFGHETKWKLADEDGNTLLSSFPYEGNMNYMSNSCLDACSCYEFTIYDVGKDGMCCKFGNGGYKLEFDGKEVASGSKFSFKKVHELGNCQKWYSLGSKCSKKETIATVNSFESSTQTSPSCMSWCSKNDLPWYASEPGEYQKCDWESTCAGCKECQAGFEDLENLPCKSWCGEMDVPWRAERDGEEQLCDWKDSCAGCKECSAVRFESGLIGSDHDSPSSKEISGCHGFFCPLKKYLNNVVNFFQPGKKYNSDSKPADQTVGETSGIEGLSDQSLNLATWKNDSKHCMVWCKTVDVPWYSSDGTDYKCDWLDYCYGCVECKDFPVLNDTAARKSIVRRTNAPTAVVITQIPTLLNSSISFNETVSNVTNFTFSNSPSAALLSDSPTLVLYTETNSTNMTFGSPPSLSPIAFNVTDSNVTSVTQSNSPTAALLSNSPTMSGSPTMSEPLLINQTNSTPTPHLHPPFHGWGTHPVHNHTRKGVTVNVEINNSTNVSVSIVIDKQKDTVNDTSEYSEENSKKKGSKLIGDKD